MAHFPYVKKSTPLLWRTTNLLSMLITYLDSRSSFSRILFGNQLLNRKNLATTKSGFDMKIRNCISELVIKFGYEIGKKVEVYSRTGREFYRLSPTIVHRAPFRGSIHHGLCRFSHEVFFRGKFQFLFHPRIWKTQNSKLGVEHMIHCWRGYGSNF